MTSSALGTFGSLARIAVALVGELVGPTRCAACDESVAPKFLFCAACATSVMLARAPHGLFAYGGSVATAIALFKYAGRSDLAVRFGEAMASAVVPLFAVSTESSAPPGPLVDLVVPVPLHPRRLAERGFDQAALLARPVARALGVALRSRTLERTRPTPPQASLDRAARASNVAAAFRCPSPRHVEGRRILLIDDVRTTGSTLLACAGVLKDVGAHSVHTFVLANRDDDEHEFRVPAM